MNMWSIVSCSVTDLFPLQQGLRHAEDDAERLSSASHRPISTTTRIETSPSKRGKCLKDRVTDLFPLQQGLRRLPRFARCLLSAHVTDLFPLQQGLRLEHFSNLRNQWHCVTDLFPLQQGLRLQNRRPSSRGCLVTDLFPLQQGLRQVKVSSSRDTVPKSVSDTGL